MLPVVYQAAKTNSKDRRIGSKERNKILLKTLLEPIKLSEHFTMHTAILADHRCGRDYLSPVEINAPAWFPAGERTLTAQA
ncbi:MAG: hypothetical protein DRP65_10970 [Planctomycetota bacterium]|nr:MAG: hypothetical protein DRP65_10970 [Planctomycetota bacterium]